MLIWYFSNNLDIYVYVGKLPEQHFSVLLFSNPGDKTLFFLKFNEARISEWIISKTICFEANINRQQLFKEGAHVSARDKMCAHHSSGSVNNWSIGGLNNSYRI